MTPAECVGARARLARRAVGLTIHETARAAGMPRKSLMRFERGEHDPQLATIVRVARALGCTAMELVEGCDGSAR